jgi:hypothetical protein
MVRSSLASFCVLLWLADAPVILAQSPDAPPGDRGTSTVSAAPNAAAAAPRDGTIRIDGRLEEAAWLEASPITTFIQGEPVEGAPPGTATEVRVLYDGGALYVAAILYEDDPSRIARQLVRRDERGQYDHFELSLDPNLDRRTGYRFRVGASGVQRDVYLYDDVREDEAWDAVWESAVSMATDGWTVEMRIPFSQIRFAESDSLQEWGVNFSRRRVADDETTFFALESRIRHGRVSVFGRLTGLLLPKTARRIELRPYVLGSLHVAPEEAGNPFFGGSQGTGNMGVDLRYGVTPTHTLDLAINPDFGQVEVDPAVINLSAFETFFPEKRPFFVEDGQVFSFNLGGGRNQLFYSRRIGREPQGNTPDSYEFSTVPSQSTILGAAKLTGRSSGGLAMGALAAVTANERGEGFDVDGDSLGTFVVQPRTWHGVVRLTQDLRGGATQIGGMVTGLYRELPSDGTFDFLTRNAVGLGLDFDHQWGGVRSRDWSLSGFFTGSMIGGENDALIRVQRSSNHYYQRPDATRFTVDSTATFLAGRDWRVQLDRRATRGLSWGMWVGELSSGYEVNDLGFLTSSERLDSGARASYESIQPSRVFRSWRLSAYTFHHFRHEALDDVWSWSSWKRAYKNGFVNVSADLQFRNLWGLDLSTRFSPQTLSDNHTRGGPLMVDPASFRAEIRGNTDRRKTVALEPSVSFTWGRDRYVFETGIELSLRPLPTIELEIEPSWQNQTDPAQYVTQTEDLGYTPTYGAHYLFSDIHRKELSLDTRLNITFTTRLTFQLFAQPLVSSGDYFAYKHLAAAETFDFDVYERGTAAELPDGSIACTGGRICQVDDQQYVDFDGDGTVDFEFSDRSFSVQSLRFNAVLRWEFRRGSTIYLVWQQSRRGSEDRGTFDLWNDLGQLGGAPADNVFIAKITYWFGL